MPRTGDAQTPSTSSWVDRVRVRERAAPPTAKTDDTLADDGVHAPYPTDKTDETPPAEGITSVLTVTPAVHVETDPSTSADESLPRAVVNPGMLMTVGHYHGYPPLPLKPGVSVAEGYTAWRTFTRDSREEWLELAADAMRTTWPDDPMIHDLIYVEPEPPADDRATGPCPSQEDTPMSLSDGLNRPREMQREPVLTNEQAADAYVPDSEYDEVEVDDSGSLEKALAGCCTPGKPCPDHIDDVIEAWQDARLDRHLGDA